jgi:hypothetical protein
MARTILHIGAHKTATTYMQKKLALNVEALDARGIHYDPLEIFRKNFTNSLQDPAKGNAEYREALKEKIRTQDVILSEENIPGVPGDLVRGGNYYLNAHERVKLVCRLLDLEKPEIFMALREYSGFIVSMYCEYIRHQKFLPFADYFEIYRKSGFRWPQTIAEISAAVPQSEIKLWDFTKFRTQEPRIFDALLGQDASFLHAPEGPVRESFSETAIQVIGTLSGMIRHHELKQLINPIARALPKGDDHKAFNPLAADVVEELKALYAEDLKTIAAMPRVTFIGE